MQKNVSCVFRQYVKRMEAEALLKADEERLRKQMNAKKAKEEAEKLHQVGYVDALIYSKCCQ